MPSVPSNVTNVGSENGAAASAVFSAAVAVVTCAVAVVTPVFAVLNALSAVWIALVRLRFSWSTRLFRCATSTALRSSPKAPSRSSNAGNAKPLTSTVFDASEVLLTTDEPKFSDDVKVGMASPSSFDEKFPLVLVSLATGPFDVPAVRFTAGDVTATALLTALMLLLATDCEPLLTFCSKYDVPSNVTGTRSTSALDGCLMVDALSCALTA